MLKVRLVAASIVALALFPAMAPAAPQVELRKHEIVEDWFTTRQAGDNVDSPAAWHGEDGESLLLVSGKESHSINVFDARNGYFLRRVGKQGDAEGDFYRPNGVWVVDDLLFVVERDNKRVQVLRLPSFQTMGVFGAGELTKPYGICVMKVDKAPTAFT